MTGRAAHFAPSQPWARVVSLCQKRRERPGTVADRVSLILRRITGNSLGHRKALRPLHPNLVCMLKVRFRITPEERVGNQHKQ